MFPAGFPYDPTRETRRLAVLIPIYIGCEAAFIVQSGYYGWFIQQLFDGSLAQPEIDATASLVDATGLVVAVCLILALIACVAVSGMWIYRVSTNSAVLFPSDARITPGWSVGWFFIPIANLWMPFRGMKQIYSASAQPASFDSAIAPVMPGWWACFIIGNILGRVSFRLDLRAETLGEYAAANYFGIAGSVFSIVAAVLWLRIVKDITGLQAAATPPQPDSKGDADDET